MRFKAKLAPEQVSLLSSLVGSMRRLYEGSSSESNKVASGQGYLTGGSILKVDSKKVLISTSGKGDADGVAFYCELTTRDGIFLEHRIDSAAPDNAIAMEIGLGEFRVALRSIVANLETNNGFHASGEDAMKISTNNGRHTTTVLKLAKREGVPCLCVETLTRDGVVTLSHAIPVRVMRVDEVDIAPPYVSVEDFHSGVPIGVDRNLRFILERLQGDCPHVCLETSAAGELTLKSDGDGSCSVRTFFGKTKSRHGNSGGSREPCKIKVDTKILVSCLQWQQSGIVSHVSSALLCFAEDEMLVVHVALSPSSLGFFTYSLPIHFLSDEDL
ncbi:Checkpoint protein [Seminavis robusta]|uniref:Checkpoint protein n=1 Tax=Seminavis robusta TaxID=568900 RepID=A0A9N8DW73_9STRA|nr:Checkpoint protein [Seminavis robusta]|eukprot:Sro397_g134510.1 Checkpoint protein (329) ;mRNA; r:49983-51254